MAACTPQARHEVGVGEVGGVGRQGDGHEHTVCWATWGALGKGELCVCVRADRFNWLAKKLTISPTRDIRAVSGEKRIIESIQAPSYK
jgi:hypothetical protein